MGFWSSVKDTFSAAATYVSNAAKTVYRAAKWAAKKALTWMADEGHRFVDDVKSTWAAIRPHIEMVVRPIMRGLESITATIPWLHNSIKIINRVLDVLVSVVGTALAFAIEKAIRWTFDLAKYIVDNYLRREDWEVAEQHRALLAQAEDADGLDPEDKHAIEATGMLLDFHLARAKVVEVIDKNSIRSFDQYLRLLAANKLLALAEQKLRAAESQAEISADDIFIVDQSKELIKDKPKISPEDMARLDGLVEARLGRKLLPFVFQELMIAWAARLDQLDRDWLGIEAVRIKKKAALNSLKNRQKFGLSDEEAAELKGLQAALPGLEGDAGAALRRKHEMQKYVYAAEGFLIFMEKSEDQLEAEGEDYLAEAATEVAPIIIDCAQHARRWSDLSEEHQNVISRFALIYESSFKQRMLDVRS